MLPWQRNFIVAVRVEPWLAMGSWTTATSVTELWQLHGITAYCMFTFSLCTVMSELHPELACWHDSLFLDKLINLFICLDNLLRDQKPPASTFFKYVFTFSSLGTVSSGDSVNPGKYKEIGWHLFPKSLCYLYKTLGLNIEYNTVNDFIL